MRNCLKHFDVVFGILEAKPQPWEEMLNALFWGGEFDFVPFEATLGVQPAIESNFATSPAPKLDTGFHDCKQYWGEQLGHLPEGQAPKPMICSSKTIQKKRKSQNLQIRIMNQINTKTAGGVISTDAPTHRIQFLFVSFDLN